MKREIINEYLPSILSIIFGIIAILALLTSSFETVPPYVVGENLILTEIHLLPSIYLKPMTLFTYAFFLSFVLGLYTPNTLRRVRSFKPNTVHYIYIFSWFLAMVSGFELLYHTVLWSAAFSHQGLQNPDIIINPWPQNSYPINVVFSAKLVVLIFFVSIFVVDYMKRIKKSQVSNIGLV